MRAQYLQPALIAKPHREVSGAFDVGKQEGDGAVWSGVWLEIGTFGLHGDHDRVDGREGGDRIGALGSQLKSERLLQVPLHVHLPEFANGSIQVSESLGGFLGK